MKEKNRWEMWLSALPDDIFYPLLKKVMGKSFPAGKAAAIRKLINFFEKRDYQESILSELDQLDCSILCAILNTANANEQRICASLPVDYSKAELRLRLIRLSETLLVFPSPGSEDVEIAVNPLLQPDFVKELSNSVLILPSVEVVVDDGFLLFSNNLYTMFFAYLMHTSNVRISTDKGIMRIMEKFSVYFEGNHGKELLRLFVNGLAGLNLVEVKSGIIKPNIDAWKELFDLSLEEVNCRIIAAILDKHFYLSSYRNRSARSSLDSMFSMLPRGAGCTKENLIRRLSIAFDRSSVSQTEKIFEMLAKMGVLYRPGDSNLWAINPKITKGNNGTLTLQADFSVFVDGELNLKHGFILGLFAEPVNLGPASSLKITRKSFMRGKKNRLPTTAWKDILSKSELPQGLLVTLEGWDNDYHSVKFYEGVLLEADERKQMLLEKSRGFMSCVKAKPYTGLYILDSSSYLLWANVLERIGITVPDLVCKNLSREPSTEKLSYEYNSQYTYNTNPSPGTEAKFPKRLKRQHEETWGPLPVDLFPETGKPKESRGVDHRVKRFLLEEAVNTRCFLAKIVWVDSEGNSRESRVFPLSLSSTQPHVLEAANCDTHKIINIGVRKIFELKLIRFTLFPFRWPANN